MFSGVKDVSVRIEEIPDLACYVLDVNGDGRDEVVTWGDDSVWIYRARRTKRMVRKCRHKS